MASTKRVDKIEQEAPSLVHQLLRPITSFGEEVTELRFREPRGSDISAVGNPVILDMVSDPPRVTHDERKMAAMMSRLSGMTPQDIDKLGPQDWTSCAWLLTNFFVPAPGTI
jgi:hypothetical protein